MKTYTAEYYHHGEIISKINFDAPNWKQAWSVAQHFKLSSPELQSAGRVRTSVNCEADIRKKVERVIKDSVDIQKKYQKLRAKGKITRIDFLE